MLQNNSWMGITQYALEDTVVRTEWSASLAFDSQCQVNNKWQMIDFCCEKIGIATLHFRNGLSQHFSVCCLVVGVLGNGMFAILGEYQVNKERGRYLVNTSVKVQSYKERWWGDLQTIVISWPSNSGSALPESRLYKSRLYGCGHWSYIVQIPQSSVFNLLKRDFEVFVGVGEVLVESCIQHSFAVWQ